MAPNDIYDLMAIDLQEDQTSLKVAFTCVQDGREGMASTDFQFLKPPLFLKPLRICWRLG
jgi:hypothetical protein